MQGTVQDIRKALEANPVCRTWLDWTPCVGHKSTPNFVKHISQSLQRLECFVTTGKKVGHSLEYRYCPEFAVLSSTTKASSKGKRGYTDMGKKSKNVN